MVTIQDRHMPNIYLTESDEEAIVIIPWAKAGDNT